MSTKPSPLRANWKNASILFGGMPNLGQAPFCKLGGCNQSRPKSAPRAPVMAIICGLCFCCTADRLRYAKRSAIVFACDGGRTAQRHGANRRGAAREKIFRVERHRSFGQN